MAPDFTNIFQKLNELDASVKADWNGDDALRDKLILIKPLCENRLKNPYAALFVPTDEQQLQQHVTNLIAQVKAFKSGNNANAQIRLIDSSIAGITQVMSKIPFVGKGETSKVLTEVIDDFEQRNAGIIHELTHEKDTLANEIANLKKDIEALSSEVDQKNNEVVTLTLGFQKQFSSTQSEGISKFNKVQEDIKHEFDTKEAERRGIFDEHMDEIFYRAGKFTEQADANLREMEAVKTKTEKIYRLIGETAIAGSQRVYADKARTMAHWLQALAVLAMGGAIYMMFRLFGGSFEAIMQSVGTLSLTAFIFRFSMSAICLLPAYYLAKEGRKQREKENKYRELEIKMTAIPSYFDGIDDGRIGEGILPEKDRVKLELAQKLLSPSEGIGNNNIASPSEEVKILEALKLLLTALKSCFKS